MAFLKFESFACAFQGAIINILVTFCLGSGEVSCNHYVAYANWLTA